MGVRMGNYAVSFNDLNEMLESDGMFSGFNKTRRLLKNKLGPDGFIGRSYFMDGSSNSLWLADSKQPRVDVGALNCCEQEVLDVVKWISPFVKVMEEGVEAYDYELHDRRRAYEMTSIILCMRKLDEHNLGSRLKSLESKASRILGDSWNDAVGPALEAIRSCNDIGYVDKAFDMLNELDSKLDKLASSSVMEKFNESMDTLDKIIEERNASR